MRRKKRKPAATPLPTVTGAHRLPLAAVLFTQEPETLAGLAERIPYDEAELPITDNRVLRPPYLNVLNAISQLLQDNGYEEACKFLDCTYER